MKISSQLHAPTALPQLHGQIFVAKEAIWPADSGLNVLEMREIFYPSRESNLHASVNRPVTSSQYRWVIPAFVCVRTYVCMYHSMYASATECISNLFFQPESTRSLELYILRSLPLPEI